MPLLKVYNQSQQEFEMPKKNRFADEDIDILLIQPSTLFSKTEIDPIVRDYYQSLELAGKLTGDDPLEANYGILSLATNLHNSGIKVAILDFNYLDWELRQNGCQLDDENILNKLYSYHPKLIGISYMTTSYAHWESKLRNIIRRISHMTKLPLIYGGIHPAVMEESISIADENVYLFRGEGDVLFKELCKTYLNNNPTKSFYHSNIIDSDIVLPQALSTLPLPNYNLWPTPQKGRRFYTMRGCSGVCAFCSARKLGLRSNKSYMRPMCASNNDRFKKIINAIYREKISGFEIIIGDLTFFTDQTYSNEFCKKLIAFKEQYGITLDFWCQSRSDCINNDSAVMISEAGGRQVAIGGETTRTETLQKFRKGITFKETLNALEILKKNDIETQLYMIIAGGGESRGDVEYNIKTITHLIEQDMVDLVHLSIMIPYPGTEVYSNPDKFGLKIVDYDFRNYWMNCDMYGYGRPVYDTIDNRGKTLLSSEEIYDLWLCALKEISLVYKKRFTRKGDNHNENVLPLCRVN